MEKIKVGSKVSIGGNKVIIDDVRVESDGQNTISWLMINPEDGEAKIGKITVACEPTVSNMLEIGLFD